MSTSKTYQQSLADAGSETRPPMLERGSYIPWASRFRRYINQKRENRKWLNKALDEGPYQFEMVIPNNSIVLKLQTAKDLQGDAKKLENLMILWLHALTGSFQNTSSDYVTHPTSVVVIIDDEFQQDDGSTTILKISLTSAMLNQAIIQGDRVNIQSRNSGNAGRNNRRAYVQEEIIEGSNAQIRTECSKGLLILLQKTLQLFNATTEDEAGVILTDEQNDFLFADASRMEEIEELSANICLMARIQPADNTSDAGPSYDSAFIINIGDDQIDSDIIFDSPNGNVNSGSIEKDTHVPDLCALEQLARNAYQEAEK
ncbi:hypothetical protein Tco_0726966 [Tanacetum coccineum]|uniref:Uncharacterized protein n=1 Tax=Tanacetum coccineum TaxID=301880 RepID=A0ABQ4YHN8_9ASTR